MESKKAKILYIAGLGRNGGTLLDRILGQINGFFSLGEFKFVWKKGVLNNELCSCGAPFRNCLFWKKVFEKAFGGFDETFTNWVIQLSHHVDRTFYVPLLISSWKPKWYLKRCKEYIGILEKLFNAIKEESECKVLIDSSKFPGYGLILNKLSNFDLYVIHLVRSSQGSAFSWQKKKRKIEVQDGVEYMPRHSPLHSSLEWVYRNGASELLKYFSKRYLLLRYEDFASKPKQSVYRIISLLHESCDGLSFLDDYTVWLGNTHTQSGNPSRFKKGKVNICLDDEWKTKLSPKNKSLVAMLTWPLMIKYGYYSHSTQMF